MIPALRPVFPWIWPGGLVLAATLVLGRWESGAAAVSGWLPSYGWLPFAGAALLAWRFRRSRVVAVLAGLILFWTVSPEPAGVRWDAGLLVLTGCLAVLGVARDRSVFSVLGGLQIAATALVTGVALYGEALLGPVDAGPIGALYRLLGPAAPAWAGVPVAVVVVALTAVAVTLTQGIRLRHPAERALAWTVVLLGLLATTPPASTDALLSMAAAGLVLMLGTLETSYALAYRDELTGLPTRRALKQLFDDLGTHYAVAMVDVDHFKKFNDRHGHDVGDQVLKMVAARLEAVTGGGRSFRYGGEEFTVVFPGKGREDALDHLEKLRERIQESQFSVRRAGRPRKTADPKATTGRRGTAAKRAPRKLSVTVSIGVAERTEKLPDPDSVVKAADKALYRAKRAGRNRVSK